MIFTPPPHSRGLPAWVCLRFPRMRGDRSFILSVYRGNYGGASVLWSLYNRLREDEREVFLIGLGNALEKNASRKALSQMVLFASNPVLDVDHSIDILGSPACSGIDRLWACLRFDIARGTG